MDRDLAQPFPSVASSHTPVAPSLLPDPRPSNVLRFVLSPLPSSPNILSGPDRAPRYPVSDTLPAARGRDMLYRPPVDLHEVGAYRAQLFFACQQIALFTAPSEGVKVRVFTKV